MNLLLCLAPSSGAGTKDQSDKRWRITAAYEAVGIVASCWVDVDKADVESGTN